MQVAPAEQAPIAKSASLDESFQRAHGLALEQGLGLVTLEHLLFALTDDPEAIGVMQASHVVVDRLRADVSGYLGRLNETLPPAGPNGAQPGPDLLRIVQLAGMAARQSPRKLIDGAIVLAAIIGDANSPSAGLLKAHGLTFEEVIRVLQQANQSRIAQPAAAAQLPPPSTPPRPKAPEPATAPPPTSAPAQAPRPVAASSADTADILASVRARVKKAEPPLVAVRPPSPVASPPPPTPGPAPASPPQQVAPKAAPPPSPPQLAEPPKPPTPDNSPPVVAREDVRTVPLNAPPATEPTPAVAPVIEPQPPQAQPPQQTSEPLAGMRPIAAEAGPSRPPLPPPPPSGEAPQMPPGMRPPPPLPTPPQQNALPPMPPPAQRPPMPTPAQMQPQQRPMPPAPTGHAPPSQPQQMPAPQQYQPHQQQPPAQQPMPLRPSMPLDIMAAASTIPSRMRVGEPTVIDIVIPRDQLDIMRPSAGRPGNNPYNRIEPAISRAVSVQLVSEPAGAFSIAALSPETVWFDHGPTSANETAVWRFAVTPTKAGRFGIMLATGGRTIGSFGAQPDANAPYETFEVRASKSIAPVVGRVVSYLVVFLAGAVTAFFSAGPILSAITAISNLIFR